MLELRDVSVRLGRRLVLDTVSATLEAGRLTVLVGPNGAGKSTMMKVLTGELRPAAGAVLLGGEPLSGMPPEVLAGRRAVLPQSSALAFPFTVLEVVRLGLDGRHGLSAEDRRRAPLAALGRVDLAGFGPRRFQDLSGGEQQRVHLARVLCQAGAPVENGTPRALFLDEPTSSLDIRHQVEVLSIARDFADEGGLAFAILHDINLAAAFADRLMVIEAGRIVADGAPETVLGDPLLGAVFGIPLLVHRPPHGAPVVVPEIGRPPTPPA